MLLFELSSQLAEDLHSEDSFSTTLSSREEWEMPPWRSSRFKHFSNNPELATPCKAAPDRCGSARARRWAGGLPREALSRVGQRQLLAGPGRCPRYPWACREQQPATRGALWQRQGFLLGGNQLRCLSARCCQEKEITKQRVLPSHPTPSPTPCHGDPTKSNHLNAVVWPTACSNRTLSKLLTWGKGEIIGNSQGCSSHGVYLLFLHSKEESY